MSTFLRNFGFRKFFFLEARFQSTFDLDSYPELRDELNEFDKENDKLPPPEYREKLISRFGDLVMNQRLILLNKNVQTIKTILIVFLIMAIIGIILGIIGGVQVEDTIKSLKYRY